MSPYGFTHKRCKKESGDVVLHTISLLLYTPHRFAHSAPTVQSCAFNATLIFFRTDELPRRGMCTYIADVSAKHERSCPVGACAHTSQKRKKE